MGGGLLEGEGGGVRGGHVGGEGGHGGLVGGVVVLESVGLEECLLEAVAVLAMTSSV